MSAQQGDVMIYVIAALVVVSAVQSLMLWSTIRTMNRLGRFEERLTRCAHGLSLLVDTSESGFAMLGNELSKLGTTPPRRNSSKTTTRRIVSAARRGGRVPDIAAAERLSEGEVRLRLHLANTEVPGAERLAGDSCDTLCA